MGCDIHIYPEYRKVGDDGWNAFCSKINPGRNYWLFAELAGVCGQQSEGLVPARGFPEDAAYAARNANYLRIKDGKAVSHPDWHSHSWLSLTEFRAAYAKMAERVVRSRAEHPEEYAGLGEDYFTEPECQALMAAMQKLEELGFESRLVFWFDN